MTDNLRAQLIYYEGYRRKPYTDTEGNITIGVGRNLSSQGVTDTEIDIMLDNDVYAATADVHNAFPWASNLPVPVFDVLRNMCFNMGIPKLKTFKRFLAALQKRDWNTAAKEMLNSRWAKKLPKRAKDLSLIVRGGGEKTWSMPIRSRK